jgi:O-antigen/teichoic acid export membrane protein
MVLSSGLVIGSRAGGVLAGLVLQLALARMLGAADLGLYFMTTGLALVLATVCAQGYPLMIPKFAAQDTPNNATGSLVLFMRHALSSVTFGFIVLCIPIIIWIGLAPSLETAERTSYLIVLMSVPALALLRVNGALANAFRRFSLGYVPDLLARPALLLGFVAFCWAAGVSFDLATLLLAQLAIAVTVAIWQHSKVRNNIFPHKNNADTRNKPSKGVIRTWRLQALKLLPAMVFLSVFADASILVMGTMLESEQLAAFGISIKISMIVAFVVHTVHQIAVRDLADALHDDDRATLQLILSRTNLLGLLATMSALVITVVAGDKLLGLYGSEFSDAYWCLNLLIFAQLIRAAAGPCVQVLAIINQENSAVQAFALSFVALVLTSAILVPAYSLLGAAVSVVVSTCIWAAWQTIQVYRNSGILIALDLSRLAASRPGLPSDN